MSFGLEGLDLALALAALVTGAVWLIAAGLVFLARRPPEPPVGPKTLELGPEPPAVANFLVNGFRVTDGAVPATLIDLAARNVVDVEQRGPGVFYIRLRPEIDELLNAYEQRVLDHLVAHARDGVVPAAALTTGPVAESKRWRRRFSNEVVADAQRRGLSEDALGGGVFTLLTGVALIPAALTWVVWEFEAGLVVLFGGIALLGWIRARHPQLETPEGLVAASRWLGVRAQLAENEVFPTHSPLTVELWDRLLSYGAALGVASGASGPLPMGTESDREAWSAYGGRWRRVRIAYPRVWPPAWGADPLVAFGVGLAVLLASGLCLYVLGPSLVETGALGAIPLLIACGGVILGAALVVMAGTDWRTAVEVTGPVLRLRTFGDDDKRRHYVAVDDGTSDAIRAWRVSRARYEGLRQGEVITARLTRNLSCVRWIVRPGDDAAA
ncbi:MAG TPA: hypothetical protein VLA69_08740 [Gaiellaceae bacterium]|nr:hypothetical protein [Gaiellaceae bacterium]